MAEGNPYIESKPRASLIKCFMSLYCTNIDVYFDKRDVQFQMCWKIWYAQLQFEAPGFGEIWLKVVGCFYKKSLLGFITVFHIQFRLASYFSTTEFWGLWSYLSVAVAGFCTDFFMSLLFIKSEFDVLLKYFLLLKKKEKKKFLNLMMMTFTGCCCCQQKDHVMFANWQNCLQWTNMLCTVRTFYILWLYMMKLLSLITWKKTFLDVTYLILFFSLSVHKE